MIAKLYYLLDELKDEFTNEKLAEVMECFNEMPLDDLYLDMDKSIRYFNGQNEAFYYELAKVFVEDMDTYPGTFFLIWENKLELFNDDTLNLFFQLSLEISDNSNATDYINGIIELQANRPEIALFHFNRLDDVEVCYFIALCYFSLGNYENAVYNYLEFLDEINELIADTRSDKIDLEDDFSIRYTKWRIYNDIGFCFNRIEEYENAKVNYENCLEIYNLDNSFTLLNYKLEGNEIEESQIFINNFLLSLEKLKEYDKCIEVLDFAITKFPNDSYYSKQKIRFQEKTKISFGDTIIKQLFKPRKPFGIDKFTETKLLSRERNLEDMIIAQIKYGFKVFNRNLEVYNSDRIHGRQYYIPHANAILDLLLVEKETDQLYVVELKRNEAGIEVVSQIENYMQGIANIFDKEVKGIICVHKADRELESLVNTKPDIELFTYEFNFKRIDVQV